MYFPKFFDIEICSYSRDISHFLAIYKKCSNTAAVVSDVRMPEIKKKNKKGVKH